MTDDLTASARLTAALVEGWMTELSNWGRWGPDDELGTLNHIAPEARRRGAAEVREGVAVSCGHDLYPHGPNVQRYMISSGLDRHEDGETADRVGASDDGRSAVAAEFLGMIFHGMTVTHIDAPSHVFWKGQMYNGWSAGLVNDRHGATRNDVRAAAQGITSRGVLLDIPALLGVDAMEPGAAVTVEMLDAAVDRVDVSIETGDVLLVRTGEAGRRRGVKGYTGSMQPGLSAWCLPWLHDRGVAMLGSDVAQDVRPAELEEFGMPIHTVGLVAMGLWLLDNCDLDDLAVRCAELGRASFQFVIGPLRFRGATGSPVNPLAIL